MSLRRASLTGLLFLVLSVAGCGGGGNPAVTFDIPAPTATAAAPAAASASTSASASVPTSSSTSAAASASATSSTTAGSAAADKVDDTLCPLGINLEIVRDWARTPVFVDVVKSSRRFGTVARFWDTPCPVDANGWPTTDFGFVAFSELPSATGTYLLSFNGRATVACNEGWNTVRSYQYDPVSDASTAEVVVGPNPSGRGEGLTLRFTNTVNGCRNIRLLRPGYGRDSRELFNDAFIRRLAPFRVLRAMQFMSVIDSPLVHWSERPLPTDAQQTSTRGVALEYLAQLANRAQKDLWLCIPDQADDEYVRSCARLLKGTLNADRVVYLEWSNEVWNGFYQEAQRNLAAARAEGEAGPCELNDFGAVQNPGYWAWRRVARRSIQIGAIFKEVFGDQASRVRLVLPHQTEQPYMLDHQLRFVARYYGPPASYFYGVAGAPYFGIDPPYRSITGLTADDVLRFCQISLDRIIATRIGYDPTYNGVLNWNRIPTQNTLARYYGLKSLAYEGGPDTAVGADSLGARIAANRDPRMADMVTRELTEWFNQGNGLFCYFLLAEPENQNGQAGIFWDITVDTPKSLALWKVAATALPTPTPVP